MFRGLVQPKPRDEFNALHEKLKTIRNQAPPLVDIAMAYFGVKFQAFTVEKLLGNMQEWEAVSPMNPERSRQLVLLKMVVDREMSCIRKRVYLMKLTHFRRFFAACKLQAQVLRLLYEPRLGDVPRISRALVRDGTLRPTGAESGAIGSGDSDCDSDSDSDAVDAHACQPPSSHAPASRQDDKYYLPLLP